MVAKPVNQIMCLRQQSVGIQQTVAGRSEKNNHGPR